MKFITTITDYSIFDDDTYDSQQVRVVHYDAEKDYKWRQVLLFLNDDFNYPYFDLRHEINQMKARIEQRVKMHNDS